MSLLLALFIAGGHWSRCVHMWVRDPYTRKFYVTCTYEWIEQEMTKEEAIAEAVRRWGPGSSARISKIDHHCYVGSKDRYFGMGLSWDAAFADADRRAR